MSSPFADYAPSLVELSIVVGAFAVIALLFTLAERYLPMGEHEGHTVGVFPGSSKPVASAAPLFDGAGGGL
jgi:hypothetical protein